MTAVPKMAMEISASFSVVDRRVLARSTDTNPAAAAAHATYQVELEIADTQQRFLDDGDAAPGQGLDPRQQFREGERLDQVIVAAGAQAAHAIVDLAERADDQGRRGDAVFPQP